MLSNDTFVYDTHVLIEPSYVYNVKGTVHKSVLAYDPTITMFSAEHILYLAVAVVLCFLLAICPAPLLCLYPTRIYERLSGTCFSPRKRMALTIFADVLHSCFKKGLYGTRDCRSLAGFILIAPLLYYVLKPAVKHVIPATSLTMHGDSVLHPFVFHCLC